ncbi:uncharacterized protein LOC142258177 isoform X1 [Anomaloglossus baeobatrachus]|uniref:uncharacterized protein LOC142258175 isoform X1 n=2 Tax=Anomaloglossus baeobatrachus TaxID=238106 RepID=UPI003F5091ED
MADTFINIDVSSGLSRALSGLGNRKHKQFLRRRKYLEKRRFLKQKQLPNKKAGETRNAWGRSRPNGQAEGHGPGRQQDGSSRTVTVGAPCQPGTLSIRKNCAANRPCPPTPSKDRPSPAMGGAKEPAKPLVPHRNLLLSEYESGLPSAAAVPPSHKVLAIDCEMVGTGFKGRNSALARCSIVNYQGDVVYDKYVRPACPVTDFRTRWSGIRREHLSNAIPFNVAQKEVMSLSRRRMKQGKKHVTLSVREAIMADTFINIDVSSGLSMAQIGSGNRKHKQFLRRRKYLEKRRFLKQKQLPNKKAGETRNAWGRSRPNGQAEGHGPGRQQDGSSRTVTVGAPCQPGTLSIGINCAANRPCPPTPSKDRPSPAMGGTKEPAKPLVPHRNLLLSEYESGLPSAAAVPPSHKVLAIDCEMVGTGFKGRNSALARCSIVNYQGDVVYDKYVRPACPVTDFRTRWSGIRREHLSNAIPFNVAQKEARWASW